VRAYLKRRAAEAEALRAKIEAEHPRDEWERRLLGLAIDCGVSLPDSAVSSDGLYD
jgi:hypothetical protein